MPEIEEVEPLQWMALHARFQMAGVTLHGLLDPRLATAALDGAAVIEGREIDPEAGIGTALLAHAAQGVSLNKDKLASALLYIPTIMIQCTPLIN